MTKKQIVLTIIALAVIGIFIFSNLRSKQEEKKLKTSPANQIDFLTPDNNKKTDEVEAVDKQSNRQIALTSNIGQKGAELSSMLKPNANLHPIYGEYLDYPLSLWPREVPRWQEGTYFFFLELANIPQTISLTNSRFVDALKTLRDTDAAIFIDITTIPQAVFQDTSCVDGSPPNAGIWPPDLFSVKSNGCTFQCVFDNKEKCAPKDYEQYRQIAEMLITYLSVPASQLANGVMPNTLATQTLGIAGQPPLGVKNINYIFGSEPNIYAGWADSDFNFFKLYDYWIAAVRNVRQAYPKTTFKIGVQFNGDVCIKKGINCPNEGFYDHSLLLNYYLPNFFSFLKGSLAVPQIAYEYHSQPPLELEFYTFNPRQSDNYHWVYDWPDKFYQKLKNTFTKYGFVNLPYAGWALESAFYEVAAPLLPGVDERPFLGIERDNEIGASAQIALQHDASKIFTYSWAEFIRDAGESINIQNSIMPVCGNGISVNDPKCSLYRLYTGGTGGSFTFGNIIKATYNVQRMMGMQEKIRLPVKVVDNFSPPNRDYVGVIVTKSANNEDIAVLVYYYIPPSDAIGHCAGNSYDRLRKCANKDGKLDFNISLDGLKPGKYQITRYLVDETHSNGFTYRQQICNPIIDRGGKQKTCGVIKPDEVNHWTRGNNPYNASVALEQVENRKIENFQGTMNLIYQDVAPWTVMFIKLSLIEI
ncbi:MAG: hypothetical protein HYV53_03655 [Parcubacteria group bacterium]|nr:hypothetical protein [Parcubacteria group bacterium]